MKAVKFLSPTSLSLYQKDPESFYLRYLAQKSPPKEPQTLPMSVGSSFDAYIKSYLHKAIFGSADPRFEFATIFENQVEEQNRDWALDAGLYAFDCYKKSGALLDILTDLQGAQVQPRFEFTIEGSINGVPFLGKPDIYFTTKQGVKILLDWKVNGFLSNSPVSPKRGYVKIRDGWSGKPSRNAGHPHKDCHLLSHNGVMINIAETFDRLAPDWAQQLAIYGWLCGEPVGSDFIVALDQLVCAPDCEGRPKIRVAEYRSRISETFQTKVFNQASRLWQLIISNHFFPEMSLEQSQERCATLDAQHVAFEDESILAVLRM